MSLVTSATLSMSQINGCARFTNGNVGIGTTAPAYKLDILGSLNSSSLYKNGVAFSGGSLTYNNTLGIAQTSGTTITSGTPILVNYSDQNSFTYETYIPNNMTSGNFFTITNTGSTRSSYANINSNLFVRMGSSTTSGSLARLRKGETLRVVTRQNNPSLPKHLQTIISRQYGSGVTWGEQAIPNNRSWMSACWAPELGLFCAVNQNSAAVVMTSPDGITWTERAIPNTRNWQSVCWAPELGLFCAVNQNSAAVVMTSPDGITWTERAIPNTRAWMSVCWAPELGLFCAVNWNIAFVMTSADGVSWTERAIPNNRSWVSVCWAPELGLFCAVNSGSAAFVMTSPNGITWTERAIPNVRNWKSVCWAPELGLFCAINENSAAVVMTSANGITWTERAIPNTRSWQDVCWAPELGLFCAVNYNSAAVVMTSANGITWTERAIPNTSNWKSVCWSPELMTFCAVNVGSAAIVLTNSWSGLYSFSSQTFTNASAIGRNGPTLTQIRSTYGGVWQQNTKYLNMTSQGIQLWTVPYTGNYTITCAGAKGDGVTTYYEGGNGAVISGVFNLTYNSVIAIVVGQRGMFGPDGGGGGGGGSFVYMPSNNNNLLIAAGGGGGGGGSGGRGGFGGGGSSTNYPIDGNGGSGNGGYWLLGYGGNGGKLANGYTEGDWNDAAGGGAGWSGSGFAGAICITRSLSLQTIYNNLISYKSEYKNANFFEYTLDGDTTYIGDGAGDMYDAGNLTQIYADSVVGSNLSYSTTSDTSTVVNGKSVNYISLGYSRPLIMLAKSSTRAQWGFGKSGNLGADGNGLSTNFTVYNGQTVNGYTVYAWCRLVYNAGDPSVGDLYFYIGDASSTFYNSMITYDPNNTDNGVSYTMMDCVNVLFGCMLCSKPGGTSISSAECQTVLTNLINRLGTAPASPLPNNVDKRGYGGQNISGSFIGGYHGSSVNSGNGGFGGGGGTGGFGNSGGGGGGYTGGGGGNNWPGLNDPGHGGGQGAGSYNTGISQTNTAATNTGNGYVTITRM